MTTVRRVLPERVPAPGSPFRRSALEPDRSRSPSILRSCSRGTGVREHDKDQRGCERREGDNRGCCGGCSKPNIVGPSSLPDRPETASTPAAAGFAGPCLRPTRGRNPEIEPGRSRERRFRSSAFAVRRWRQPIQPRYSSSYVSSRSALLPKRPQLHDICYPQLLPTPDSTWEDGETAIDADDLPVDEARARTGEEGHRFGDLFRLRIPI